LKVVVFLYFLDFPLLAIFVHIDTLQLLSRTRETYMCIQLEYPCNLHGLDNVNVGNKLIGYDFFVIQTNSTNTIQRFPPNIIKC